jgi:hypothetical protein
MKAEVEIQTAVLALKGRGLDTKEIYREVCGLLFFRFGITPTVTQLYRLVQKGSMSVPTAVLAKFWVEVRERSKIDVAHPDLPLELAGVAGAAIGALWKNAVEAANAALENFRDSARKETAAAQTRVTELETELKDANLAREAAETLREKSERLKSALTVEHEAERRGHAASIARGQELQRQVTGLQGQIESNQVTFSRDLAKAQQGVQEAVARAEAAERKSMLDVDNERQARQKAERLLEKIREQALAGQIEARDAALAQAQEIGSLRSRLAAAEANAQTLTRINEEYKVRVERLATELAEAVHRATRLDAEVMTVRAMMTQLGAGAETKTPAPRRPARSGSGA